MKANHASRCDGREVKEYYANVIIKGPQAVNQRLHRASSAYSCSALPRVSSPIRFGTCGKLGGYETSVRVARAVGENNSLAS